MGIAIHQLLCLCLNVRQLALQLFFVAEGGGHYLQGAEQKDQPHANQQNIQGAGGTAEKAVAAPHKRDQRTNQQCQRHPFVMRGRAVTRALALGNAAHLLGKAGLCGQILFAPAQLLGQGLGLGAKLHLLFGGSLLRGLFGQLLLRARTHKPNFRLNAGQLCQQKIHILLKFKIALLFLAVIVFHHQIRHGGKHSLAGKAALAHGNALIHALNAAIGNVIAAVNIKTVQIQRLLAKAAGADFFTVGFILFQHIHRQGGSAQSNGFQQHKWGLSLQNLVCDARQRGGAAAWLQIRPVGSSYSILPPGANQCAAHGGRRRQAKAMPAQHLKKKGPPQALCGGPKRFYQCFRVS